MLVKKKNIIIGILVVLLLLISIVFVLNKGKSSEYIQVESTVNLYLDSIKGKNIELAMEQVYTKNEEHYSLLADTYRNENILSYKVKSLKKVDDLLYKADIQVKSDVNHEFSPYIAYIDNRWLIYLNPNNLPDKFLKNIKIERKENEVFEDEIIR